ncbi:MAG: 2-oxoglutarate dehydrogenase [Bacteroidetes bacterium GWF2_49_14]|nr:MAG: 2-oxoglutarate dehydrogenase [Bacteroidetes bacterium GWF2_49_14]HBB91461.1 dihydrolipoyllysine-residue succinyltransferase [Bacteroidales bacterium]
MIEIKVPSPGESISEVEIGSWLVEDGMWVEKDQEIVSLESEKASLIVNSPEAGVIQISVPNGTRVNVGSTIANLDTAGKPAIKSTPAPELPKPVAEAPAVKVVEPVAATFADPVRITPVAREIMQENQLTTVDVLNGLRRISKNDVLKVLASAPPVSASEPLVSERTADRKPMSLLRKKLSERLVAVKNQTAMLTTFNEVDMGAVMDLRNRYKKEFEEKHQVKLGFMSFFTLAATRALKAFPQVNSQIDGDDIIGFNYTDIGIAVQTPKGLMVPVLRQTDSLSLAEIEIGIALLAKKARDNRIAIEDLLGGTFSITNGGVFGSLLSTPILNPPQSAILGMHNIVERPVALHGQVVIRPMMYLALSYDHRIIDGKDSVGFLKGVKEMIENPVMLLDPTGMAEKSLLGI